MIRMILMMHVLKCMQHQNKLIKVLQKVFMTKKVTYML